MKRKIGIVYEFAYKCGHTRQHTLPIPTYDKDYKTLDRIVDKTAEQECVVCEQRTKRTAEATV